MTNPLSIEAIREAAEKEYPILKPEFAVPFIRKARLEAFEAGANEVLKQLEWIDVNDKLPELKEPVLVILCTGGMGGVTKRIGLSTMTSIDIRPRFAGAFDWTYVSHWLPLSVLPTPKTI